MTRFVYCYGCGSPVAVGASCRRCAEGNALGLALHEAYLEGRAGWEYDEVVASVMRKGVQA